MKLNNIILVSDLDGTIIPASGIISERNKTAIKKLQQAGGIFSIATGRSPLHAIEIANQLSSDSMIICNNGACIYDTVKNANVWSQCLEGDYIKVINYVLDNYPNVAIQAISNENKYYILRDTDFTKEILFPSFQTNPTIKIENLPHNICKVLFLLEPNYFDEISKDILAQNFNGCEFVASGGACFEMMYQGITKGYAIENLKNLYNKKHVVTIGDYYNDIDMLKKADFSAAVSNAPNEVKMVADVVVKSCKDDGFAEFIDMLFEKYSV